jgi:hypothetical protein
VRIARELTVEHLRALRAYLKLRPDGKRYRRWQYVSILIFMSLAAFGTMKFGSPDWIAASPWLFAAGPVMGLVLCQLTWAYLDDLAESRFIAVNDAEMGHHEFWVTEDGFGNSTPAGSTFHKWPQISVVEDTPTLVLIQGGTHLYGIPIAGAENEVRQFVSEARRCWEASKAAVLPRPGSDV